MKAASGTNNRKRATRRNILVSAIISAVFIGSAFVLHGLFGKRPAEFTDHTFFALDTYITIRLAGPDGDVNADYSLIFAECERIVSNAEKTLSAHDESSELYKLNQSPHGTYSPSDTLFDVINIAKSIADRTDGAFDFTLGALSELWNIKNGGPVPDSSEIDAILPYIGYSRLIIDSDNKTITLPETPNQSYFQLDLGAIGKGFAADMLIEYLRGTDVPYGIISVGGTIGVFGSKPDGEMFKIGIRSPDDAGGLIGYFLIDTGFVAVSGDYERYFIENNVRYHHILDPKKGAPAANGVRESAVYSDSGAVADALSTAFFVMGERRAENYIDANGSETVSAVIVSSAKSGSEEYAVSAFGSGAVFEPVKNNESLNK